MTVKKNFPKKVQSIVFNFIGNVLQKDYVTAI